MSEGIPSALGDFPVFLYNGKFSNQARSTLMAETFNGVAVPTDGARISYKEGRDQAPDNPIVPFIEGEGTGRDTWKASVRKFNAAGGKAYKGKRRGAWY